MIEIATKDEKQEDNERNIFKKTLKQLRKEEDEADEARTLLDDMQQNVDEVEAQVTEARRRLYRNQRVRTRGTKNFWTTTLFHG